MRIDAADVVALLGLALLGGGVAMISVAAAAVVVGVVLLALGIVGAVRSGPRSERPREFVTLSAPFRGREETGR